MKEKKKTNVKETVKIVALLFLVVFFVVLFITTEGKDQLELDFNLDFQQDTGFSYPVVESPYNNEYKNSKNNGIYIMVGANSDGTYRVYILENIGATNNFLVKLDNAKMEDNKIEFRNQYDVPLTLVFKSETELEVPNPTQSGTIGVGDEKIEGLYTQYKKLSSFSLSEFEAYRSNQM